MPHFASVVVSILFDGLAYGMILFIISIGLSVTMGLLGFVNLAHGAFAMGGGYLAMSLMGDWNVPFPLALAASFVIVGAGSVLFERILYRPLYKAEELDQVLMTLGLVFMAVASYTYFYGPLPQSIRVPDYLQGQRDIGIGAFPTYRIFMIAIGAVLIAALWISFERTRLGATIRAAVDNRRMAQSVGIDVDRLFMLTFAFGSGLAAAGGVLSIELVGLTPAFAVQYIVLFLIVVTVGGLGSVKGTAVAALLLGIGDNAGKYLYPTGGAFFVYAITVIVLLAKPAGLYGRE